MGTEGLGNGLYSAFLDWLYRSGDISVPSDYHSRCDKVNFMLDNDITGLVNTVTGYSINSASEAHYKVQCPNANLETVLNSWLSNINVGIKGVPTGLNELSKEYFKERWQGSSFCVLRVDSWKKITVAGQTIEVPSRMWYVNGASIFVNRPKTNNYKLGTDEYFLSKGTTTKLPIGKDEYFVVQKPYDRWFTQYSTPYLVKTGVFKNWLGVKTLQEKSDEVISKILPYLFIIKKGTEGAFLKGDVSYDDKELQTLLNNVKAQLETYKNQNGKTPASAVPFDQEYSHLIPDLRNILSEELYSQGLRSILAGLGFVDVIQGLSNTRKESVLNPKPFLAETNNGVIGFKSMLMDVINIIIERNKSDHPKFFGDNNEIEIVNSPLKINIDAMLEYIRSGYDRGPISIRSYTETLGFSYDIERERRKKELEDGSEELMYPHLINNQEGVLDRVVPSLKKKEIQDKKEVKNKNKPESNNFKANEELSLEMAPYTDKNFPDYLKKYPEHARHIWITTWNTVYNETKDEAKAFKIAWSALQKYMKTLKNKSVEEK